MFLKAWWSLACTFRSVSEGTCCARRFCCQSPAATHPLTCGINTWTMLHIACSQASLNTADGGPRPGQVWPRQGYSTRQSLLWAIPATWPRFSESHCGLRLILPSPSFPLSSLRGQTCVEVWRLSLPFPASSALHSSQEFPAIPFTCKSVCLLEEPNRHMKQESGQSQVYWINRIVSSSERTIVMNNNCAYSGNRLLK